MIDQPDTKQLDDGQLDDDGDDKAERRDSETRDSETRSDADPQESSLAKLKKLDRWWTVLILLFVFMGVIGLPLLWLSQSYNRPMKVVLSILVTLYTAALFWLVWLEVRWVYDELNQAL